MKKYLNITSSVILALFVSLLFSGCVKDSITHTYKYSWYEPLYKTKAEVRADIKLMLQEKYKIPERYL